MTDNEPKGWEDEVIPEYSSIAVLNSDRVDGYEMVPAVDFIRENFISKAEVRKVAEGMKMQVFGLNKFKYREGETETIHNNALSELLRALHISEE